MNTLFLLACVCLILGLFILAWDFLKKSESKIVKIYLMPWVIRTIFIVFKLLKTHGNNLDKKLIVTQTVALVYPKLPIPPMFTNLITEAVFRDIVEGVYLFVEDKCFDFTKLLEEELNE